jgi:hypothetical protein
MGYYAGMFACLAASLQARPYTGFVLTLVMTTTALWLNRRNKLHLLKVGVTGIVFGAIACAGVLSYNHLYTGSWLVSPYAMFAGASLPPELSFNPAKIWRGIRQFAPQTIEESLIGTFPFAYLLAGYALWHEAKRRSELRILAALYTALVLAYLAHPLDSGGLPFGERFHFEAFFALLLLAARGVQLLVERWRIPRWAVVCMVLLLGVMQVSQEAAAVKAIARRGEPYRKVREAIAASGFSGLVFLRDGPGFVAKHFNLNDADWHHSRRIYLIDAEPGRRSQWACSYGALDYTVLTYDATTRQAILIPGKANCAIGTHQPSTNRCASLRKPSVNPCP